MKGLSQGGANVNVAPLMSISGTYRCLYTTRDACDSAKTFSSCFGCHVSRFSQRHTAHFKTRSFLSTETSEGPVFQNVRCHRRSESPQGK